MRSLQRILYERKTRRFIDEMIHKYADIRLSSSTRTMSRKRPRSRVGDLHKCDSKQKQEDDGRTTECSTSSICRTESERSSRISASMVDNERSNGGNGSEGQQQQEEESWRVSDARTVSEYGSAFSSTRLARLLEEEDGGDEQNNQHEASASPSDTDANSEAPSIQGTEDNQRHHSSFSECDTTSLYFESAPTSSQPSEGNQLDSQSEFTEQESPPSSSTEPSSTLPRLRPTPPPERVIPNCCDFFTSPHPHYAKEVIGMKEGSSHSVSSRTNSTSSAVTNEEEADSDSSDSSTENNENNGDDVFEMWDYVCPQHARRDYANEWV